MDTGGCSSRLSAKVHLSHQPPLQKEKGPTTETSLGANRPTDPPLIGSPPFSRERKRGGLIHKKEKKMRKLTPVERTHNEECLNRLALG